MADFGIIITPPNVTAQSSTPAQQLLNTKYPLHKLDVTKKVSFQNVTLTFTRDVNNPTGVDSNHEYYDTVVYTVAHGYNYIPQIWALFRGTGTAGTTTIDIYSYRGATFLTDQMASSATIFTNVDKTNVYFIVRKFYLQGFGSTAPVNVTGLTLKFRLYIFAETMGVPDGL